MRPPSAKPNGRAFWRDSDGFTANDFKTVVTCGTWFACTCWMAWLLMGGDGGASDLHLRFYSNISQVFMVLLGGMAANQFGSMWFGGNNYNQTGYIDPMTPTGAVMTMDDMQADPGEDLEAGSDGGGSDG